MIEKLAGRISAGMLTGLFLITPDGLQAQETSAEPDPGTVSKKAEKIRVTGSRIKRVDLEGTAPVTVMDREEIEASGETSVADLLRGTTSSPGGNFAGTSGYIRSGSATVDLLGIGSNRTLVLLDGLRLPVDQSIGAVNVDNIPLAMVEKIELYSGGASAIYGADAVGGVVNIITKKDYSGTEATTKISIPVNTGGEVLEVFALGAYNLTRDTKLTLSAGYKKTEEIIDTDRNYSKGRPPRDYTLSNAPKGTFSYRVYGEEGPGNWNASPNCPTENQRVTVPTEPDNVYCAGPRNTLSSWDTPKSDERYLSTRIDTRVNNDVSASFLALFNEKNSETNWGNYMRTSRHPIYGQGILLSSANAARYGINVAEEEVVEIFVNSTDMEDRINQNRDRTYGGVATVDADFGEWTWTTSMNYYRSTNKRDFLNVLNKEKQISLLHPDDNPVDPAYLPLDPGRNPDLLAGIYDDLASNEKSSNSVAETFLSREIMDLAGGPLTVGFGVSFTREEYEQNPDARDQAFMPQFLVPVYTGSAAVSGKGDREIGSVFAEVSAPLTTAIEVSSAIRYDEYSDFGGTFNYSLGGKLKATDNLMFRSQVASSFKAPLLSLMHEEGGGGYIYIEDENWCTREREVRGNVCEPGSTHQIFVDSPGNPDLKEETGKSYTIGVVFEPAQNVAITSDYIGIHLENSFNRDDVQDIVDDHYKGNPTGDNDIKTDDDKIISSISAPYQNMGKTEVYASKTELDAATKVAGVRLGWNTSYFRYLSYKEIGSAAMMSRTTWASSTPVRRWSSPW